MRILYIINGNGLSPHLGGSLVRSACIARHLIRLGHQIEVLTTSGGRAACESLGLRAIYHVLPSTPFTAVERSLLDRATGYLVTSVAGIIAAGRFHSFDAMYTDSDYPCDVLPAERIAAHTGIPWIAMVHHIVTDGSEDAAVVRAAKGALQDFTLRRIARHAARIFTYATPAGEAVVRRLGELGAAPGRIERVHNGYDGDALARIVADEPNDAVLLGGLRPGKGLGEIVPIWSAVVERRPDSRLRVVGGVIDEHRRWLEGQIAAAGLEGRIAIEGPRPHDEAIAAVKGSRLMLAASMQEGWGIAVCEALACGTPVVAYDLPAYRALFSSGWLPVPPGDREAAATAVLGLLDDPPARERLGAAGREAVAAYDWLKVARADMDLFAAAAATAA